MKTATDPTQTTMFEASAAMFDHVEDTNDGTGKPPTVKADDVEELFGALVPCREVYEPDGLQELAKQLPYHVAVENTAVLLEFSNGQYLVGMCAPSNFTHLRNIARAINTPSTNLKPRLLTEPRFKMLLTSAYEQSVQKRPLPEDESEAEALEDLDDPNARQESINWNDFAQSESSRVAQFSPRDVEIGQGSGMRAEAERIILDAIKHRASDIHLESALGDGGYITFRTDGIVYQRITDIAPERVDNLANAFADMAGVDGYKLNQRGMGKEISIVVKTKGGNRERMTLRFHGAPALYGRDIVIRINRAVFRDFQQIGLEQSQTDEIQKALRHRHGVCLVTGATGSGKSNTLEAMLRKLEQIYQYRKRIIQIGNPIEFPNRRRTQLPVNDEGSWADALKDAMRMDPDIFSPGEFRDAGEAGVVFQAAATGHLTLTTVHTNNVAQTFSRLDFLQIERDKQASLIQLIVSQRLVPLLCEKCKVEDPASRDIAEQLIDVVFPNRQDVKEAIRSAKGHSPFFTTKGCPSCNWSGVKGRTCIAEMLHMTPEINRMLRNGVDGDDVVKYAITNYGMMTLAEAAARKLCRGIIAYDEVFDLLMSPAAAAPQQETTWDAVNAEPVYAEPTTTATSENVIEGDFIDVEGFEVQQQQAAA